MLCSSCCQCNNHMRASNSIFDMRTAKMWTEQHNMTHLKCSPALCGGENFQANCCSGFLFFASIFVAVDFWTFSASPSHSRSLISCRAVCPCPVALATTCYATQRGTRQVWKSDSLNCLPFGIGIAVGVSILAENRDVALIKTDGHLMANNYLLLVSCDCPWVAGQDHRRPWGRGGELEKKMVRCRSNGTRAMDGMTK